jgi:hypothetical protein
MVYLFHVKQLPVLSRACGDAFLWYGFSANG